MKALTVRQPWAWAIVAGHKPVENRTRPIRYAGVIAIHAALTWTQARISAAVYDAMVEHTAAHPRTQPWLTMGAVVGTARVVGCHRADGCCHPWGDQGDAVWHWRLDQPHQLVEPVPFRGQLGLWDFPDCLLDGAA